MILIIGQYSPIVILCSISNRTTESMCKTRNTGKIIQIIQITKKKVQEKEEK